MSCHFGTVTSPAAGNRDSCIELCIAVVCGEEGEKWECLAIKTNNLAVRAFRNTNSSCRAKRGRTKCSNAVRRCSLILAVIPSGAVLLQVALEKRMYSLERFCWHSEAISFFLFVKWTQPGAPHLPFPKSVFDTALSPKWINYGFISLLDQLQKSVLLGLLRGFLILFPSYFFCRYPEMRS